MEKQPYNILCYYLRKSKIFFDKRRLKQLLTSHPDGDSLYAIVDTLNEMNIKNIALKSDLKELQSNGFPTIAFIITEKERKFIVVEDISDNQVFYYEANTGNTSEVIEEFVWKWSGILLYAEQDEILAELEQKKNISEKRLLHWRIILAVFSGLLCTAIWSVSIVWSPVLCSFLFLYLCGLIISILLTMEEFGESNQFLHKVCHLNRVTNCNAVLKSGASKLFGWLSMADIGLCYFLGCIFSLFFAGIGQQLNAVVCWLLVLAICSFPYTLFFLVLSDFQSEKSVSFLPGCCGSVVDTNSTLYFLLEKFNFYPHISCYYPFPACWICNTCHYMGICKTSVERKYSNAYIRIQLPALKTYTGCYPRIALNGTLLYYGLQT